MKMWPWSRFAQLEARNDRLVGLCRAIADSRKALIIDGDNTEVRGAFFEGRQIYITADANGTRIADCIFRSEMAQEPLSAGVVMGEQTDPASVYVAANNTRERGGDDEG
jgi:hypothetical protein